MSASRVTPTAHPWTRRRALLAAPLACLAQGGTEGGTPPATGWWVWGRAGVQGPAGYLAWPALPLGRPQAAAGALWWLDGTPAVHRLALNGAHTWAALPAPPQAWTPAPQGLGLLLAQSQRLQWLDSALRERHAWAVLDLAGRRAAQATAAVAHEGRRSLVLAVPGLGELWEISLDPEAAALYDGMVHDHRLGEGLPRPGFLGVRRLALREPADAVPTTLHAAPGQPWVFGSVPGGVAVLNLDVRRRLVTLPASADLHTWQAGQRWLWLRQGDRLQAFDAQRWQAGPAQALPAGAVQLLAEGTRLWLRTVDEQLWVCEPGQAWQNQGRARDMARSPEGAIERLDARWPAALTALQPAW